MSEVGDKEQTFKALCSFPVQHLALDIFVVYHSWDNTRVPGQR